MHRQVVLSCLWLALFSCAIVHAQDRPGKMPQADVVGLTGTSFINHTAEKLLKLCQRSFVVVVGPTSPLSPVLFDYGVDVIAGAEVVDSEKVIRYLSEGAVFRQIEGVKLVNMKRG